jgi:hypothetical protein
MIWMRSVFAGVLLLFGFAAVSLVASPVILRLKVGREVGWAPLEAAKSPVAIVLLLFIFILGFCWEYYRLSSQS